MRTPMMRPRNFSPAARNRMIESGTMQNVCMKPAASRHTMALSGPGICAKASSSAYQSNVATIIMRASETLAPMWLSTIEPTSAPPAKLATRYPSHVWSSTNTSLTT